jgi:hypothetical protein
MAGLLGKIKLRIGFSKTNFYSSESRRYYPSNEGLEREVAPI